MSAQATKIVNYDEQVYGFLDRAKGVIHVGANTGQEREVYAARGLPVIWIEPLDGVFDVLCERIAPYPNQKAYQYLITDKTGESYAFGISNNGGQSSSIFNFKMHRDIWPDVGYLATTELESVTLQFVIERHQIDLATYDALILDVQGSELLVLKGAGEHLERLNWILAEAADFESYEGGCQLKDLDAYLMPRGWRRRQLFACIFKPNVGQYYEALYGRQQ